jgi:hypothetical protein
MNILEEGGWERFYQGWLNDAEKLLIDSKDPKDKETLNLINRLRYRDYFPNVINDLGRD